ncbi:MAG: hypothetical protein AB7W16_20690 [Candidatus Obscuribacterales bacterium]
MPAGSKAGKTLSTRLLRVKVRGMTFRLTTATGYIHRIDNK